MSEAASTPPRQGHRQHGTAVTPTATLVTCHSNADFDALSAMLAAGRLYAPCDLLFPGSQEKNLNELFDKLREEGPGIDGVAFVDTATLDRGGYGRLVVVDTRQRTRLHHVWRLLDNPGIRIEVWDHHPDSGNDIHAHLANVADVGAVTSILVAQIRERGLVITRREATLLGLGIYSDTGSFTYSSTTSTDFEAAAWLLAQGMDINAINDRAAFAMTRLHVQALNSLLESAHTYTVNGVEVVLAEATLDQYLGDFAYLAHRLMEMEKFAALFAIGRMDDRIQVVARSRSNAINVGAICSSFGGGGHVYAASASIKDKSLSQVHDEIVNALYLQQSGSRTAADYMSAPPVGLEEGRTIREADELMMHFGLKSVPVFATGTRRCTGLLDSDTAQRSIAHGLSQARVDDYMQRNVTTLPPEASLKDLTTVIVDQHQRLVPIVRDGNVVGVVTRTDLFNIFASEPGRMKAGDRAPKGRNVAKTMSDRLPADIMGLLKGAGELGREMGIPVYVVGGFVRDLLLKTPNHDIDLVAEGNGLAFAEALAARLGGRVRVHRKFLTSAVLFPGPDGRQWRVDVATARLEYYESPAAMPTVEHSSIKMDLYRRDFTINALAIRLDTTPMGQIVDFFGGQRDLKDGVIRVLHTLSFVEDPTRCLRAVRFERRYGFRIGPSTEKLIHNAVSLGMLDKLSPARIFNEFGHVCEEETALSAILRLSELGLLEAIHRQFALTPTKRRILPKVSRVVAWYRLLYLDEPMHTWLVYFLGLVGPASYADALAAYQRMGGPAALKNYVMLGRERMRSCRPALNKAVRDPSFRVSAYCRILRPLPVEFLLYLMAESDVPELRRTISRYLTAWRRMQADVDGDDLRAMGLAPGPVYTVILRRLLEAKLDGKADTHEKQMALAIELAEKAAAGTLEAEDRRCRKEPAAEGGGGDGGDTAATAAVDSRAS